MTATWLFWLAVGISAIAVVVVLVGVGYLLGRRAAVREAVQALAPLSRTVEQARRSCSMLHGLAEER